MNWGLGNLEVGNKLKYLYPRLLRGCLKSLFLCHAEERSISVYRLKRRFYPSPVGDQGERERLRRTFRKAPLRMTNYTF